MCARIRPNAVPSRSSKAEEEYTMRQSRRFSIRDRYVPGSESTGRGMWANDQPTEAAWFYPVPELLRPHNKNLTGRHTGSSVCGITLLGCFLNGRRQTPAFVEEIFHTPLSMIR